MKLSMRSLSIGSALILTLASGCRSKEQQGEQEPTASASAAAAVAASASPGAEAPSQPVADVPDEAIAASEDFEDEAFAKISDRTYKIDLEALKKEIEGQ